MSMEDDIDDVLEWIQYLNEHGEISSIVPDFANGQLHIYYVPDKPIEYIQFNFIAKRSNGIFEEVLGEYK